MSNANKFQTDLENGKKGERHVAEFLKKQTSAISISRAFAGKAHDFVLSYKDGTKISYETKTDFLAAKTGNIYFEYECSNKPSGLTATKANKWAILIPSDQTILVFCPQKMWNYLQKSSHKNLKGGDRKATSGYIVSIEILKELSFVQSFHTKTRLKS